MKTTIETYPQNISQESDLPLYYIEFKILENPLVEHWTLYKRCFIFSIDKWNKMVRENKVSPLTFREGHPYNLGDGFVNQNEGAIEMNTKSFLKFMVDSLNARAYDLTCGVSQYNV